MEKMTSVIVLGLLGLCFGSFVNALVWRIRKKRDIVRERSECTHCHHILAWYDLVPVVSYLLLRGRCRYCRKPIDDTPLTELATALLFVISYLAWPYQLATVADWSLVVLWLVLLVGLVALADYDIRWYLLPDVIVFPLIVLGAVFGVLRFTIVEQQGIMAGLGTMVGGVAIIAGLYALLYAVSSGKWVGFGDVKLNVGLGLIVGWQGALVVVFLANLIGMLVILPGLVTKRLTKTSRIPFGPFLITACIVTVLWGEQLINWYIHSFLSL